MVYFGTRLSENISLREPEGYLLCLNVPVARTGTQEYLPEELGLPPGGMVPVFRPEEEVFAPACVASFEGMPLTDGHPAAEEGVNAENIRYLQKGHAHNVRRGGGAESDLLLADLIVTDPELIREIRNGKREISCGYNYVLCEEDGRYVQREIRGNHVAVVDAGRAGPRVSIRDGKKERRKDIMQNGRTAGRNRAGLLPARHWARMMARMARDGETEELAEVIGELMEPVTEAAPLIAEAVKEAAAAETPEEAGAARESEAGEPRAEESETAVKAADCGTEIVALLRQILERLPGAADGDPESEETGPDPSGPVSDEEDPLSGTVEAVVEAVTRAVETAAPDADPLEALVAEAAREAVEGTAEEEPAGELPGDLPEEVLLPDVDPADLISSVIAPEQADCATPSARTADAVRAAMKTFRPILKRMEPEARRRAVAKIAAGLKAQDRLRAAARKASGAKDAYALLRGAASPSREDVTRALGEKIMTRRNANYQRIGG